MVCTEYSRAERAVLRDTRTRPVSNAPVPPSACTQARVEEHEHTYATAAEGRGQSTRAPSALAQRSCRVDGDGDVRAEPPSLLALERDTRPSRAYGSGRSTLTLSQLQRTPPNTYALGLAPRLEGEGARVFNAKHR